MLNGRRILLVIGGGIAAYKCLELIRRLRDQGASVRAVMTASAAEFVTPLSVAALSEDKVYRDLFSLTDESEMGHIRLSREADLLLVAPATANLIARMAAGLADDLASTVLLATDKPVLIAPTMNVQMWQHAATQANIATLRARGVGMIGPAAGDLACGEIGSGRLAEVSEIIAALTAFFAPPSPRPLAGRHAVVTAGPTHEPIDPVRFIGNRSSGKQGYAIAAALAAQGARVTLVSGPTPLPDPPGMAVVRVETARQMLAATEAALPADIAVCAAAVADWRIADAGDVKLKKAAGAAPPSLALVENPDILAGLSHHAARPALVIGFAAETGDLLEKATAKRARKGCDWLLANDVSPGTGVFGGDGTRLHLVTAGGIEDWPAESKQAAADRLAARIAAHFSPVPSHPAG